MGSPDNVLIVNTSDVGGGAERISMDLLRGFRSLGTDAWLAVANKHTDDPQVVSLYTSPHVDYTPPHPIRQRWLRVRRKLDPRLGLEDFNHPYTRHLLELTGAKPDVVVCHNLHGGYFDLRRLPWLSQNVPIVLRLGDSWAFTGHCAVPGPCGRWRKGCGHCPDLQAPPTIRRDATRVNWHRKRRIYARSHLALAAPSQWMLDRVRQSMLAPAISAARVIPNGIDLSVFNPHGPVAPRAGPAVARLVFAANGGAANPYKDFATLRAAIGQLTGSVELVSVGGEQRVENLNDRIRIRHEGHLGPTELAALYRSADLYVHAAGEESFSLTAAEALACGTPVVAAAAGGISEVVEDGRTGFLHAPGVAHQMADSLRTLLGDDELRRRMGEEAVARADRFDRVRMVQDMYELCAEVMHLRAN